MGVDIEMCMKYPGGPTRMRGTDVVSYCNGRSPCDVHVTAVAVGQRKRLYALFWCQNSYPYLVLS
jgi:hypothetical protein